MTGNDPVDPAVARLLDDTPVWAEVSASLRERTLAAALGTESATRVIASFTDEPATADATATASAAATAGVGTEPTTPATTPHADEPVTAATASVGTEATTTPHADEPVTAGAEAHGARVVRPAWGRPRRPARPRGRMSRRPALLAAAAVAVVGMAVGGGVRLIAGGTGDRGVEVALAGTDQAPTAVATARLRDEPAGVAITLEVAGLPPAPEDTFYETWLIGETGKVSAGTFHQRGEQDHVDLWLGVEPEDYDAITVTRQPVAGGSLAEGVVLLRGDLPDN